MTYHQERWKKDSANKRTSDITEALEEINILEREIKSQMLPNKNMETRSRTKDALLKIANASSEQRSSKITKRYIRIKNLPGSI